MSNGNQPATPTTPRTQRFVLNDPVGLVRPNDVLEGKIGGVHESEAGFIYTVLHGSEVVRDVREEDLQERPARKFVYLIVFSRRHPVSYDHIVKAIQGLGEALELDDSVWVVRTEHTHARLYDRLAMMHGMMDLLLITPMGPRASNDWSISPFTRDREASGKLRAWLELTTIEQLQE